MLNVKPNNQINPKTLEFLRHAARNNFSIFKRVVWKRYIQAAHIEFLDYYLNQVLLYIETGGKEGIGQLLLEMPPRHGKTQNVSRLFPAYFLGRNPDKRVILTSYSASLPEGNSRWIRTLIQMPNYRFVFPHMALALDSRAKDEWNLISPYAGGLTAIGKGGAVTGKGAELLIIDDSVKNREEAESERIRQKDWDWITSDLWTRKEPGSAVISIMTRWHDDDVHGRFRKYHGVVNVG